MTRQFNLNGGVEITKVDDNSVADDAGLENGMVIVGVTMHGAMTPIANIADFRRMEAQLKSGTAVILHVKSEQDDFKGTAHVSMRVK